MSQHAQGFAPRNGPVKCVYLLVFSFLRSQYRYSQPDPLFAFGAGLSYSKIVYASLELRESTIAPCDSASLRVTVTNTGPSTSDEVVLVFAEWLWARRFPVKPAFCG